MDAHARRLTPAFLSMAAFLGGLGIGLVACDQGEAPGQGAVIPATPESIADRTGLPVSVVRRASRSSPIPEVPADPTNRVADDPRAAEFGRALFFDEGLSGNGNVSCATCHRPELHFTDGLERSEGIGTSARHAPTLVDAAHQRWFNWDGRSDSMWAHAIRPIEHPDEMGGDRTAVARHVLSDPARREAYEAIFGEAGLDPDALPERARPEGDQEALAAWNSLDEATRFGIDGIAANVGKAMAAYQRTLSGGPSRFDDWVASVRAGGDGAGLLTDSERRGLELFFGEAECWECHAGPLLSDGEFHNIGTPVPDGLPRDPGRYRYSDLGYYLLQDVLEFLWNAPLDQLADSLIHAPLGLQRIGYRPLSWSRLDDLAPTELDTLFRGGWVRGTVHDPGAAMMGGVAGHAGLFSDAHDLAVLLEAMRRGGEWNGVRLVRPETVEDFTARAFPEEDNRRATGWDKPGLEEDSGASGNAGSWSSFGHSGFTGTLAWTDPEGGWTAIFLSNRICPDAENRTLIDEDIRTKALWIIEEELGLSHRFDPPAPADHGSVSQR